jgi:release factor glutamine methyltransferase
VLIPRPETELVAEVAISFAKVLPHPVRCADLGTGSGAIGLSLLRELPRGAAEVWLTDSSIDALDVARANAAGLGMAGVGARFGHGSWFSALPEELRGTFGVIASNPPYIAVGDPAVDDSVRDWEPASALFSGADGLDAVREIVTASPEWLRPGGWLILEIGSGQGVAVGATLRDAGFADVLVRADHAGRDRIAVGRRP